MSWSHSSTPSRLPAAPTTPESAAKPTAQRRFAKRRHAETKCAQVGFQPGKHKIFQHEDPGQLELSEFRNNLTALSQRFNLYLVAGGPRLWAYTPHYPHQTVSNHPQLILQPPLRLASPRGFINRANPHAINNLIIADLGEDEIVVCACDEGDVYAYHTRAVFEAIQRRERDGVDGPLVADYIQPFFHKNVEQSAWGLAVHKTARLIAVSCNTHIIHVYAFALSAVAHGQQDELQQGPGGSGDIQDYLIRNDTSRFDADGWELNPHRDDLARRADNFCIRLTGHRHNIPTIAFCNTGDDPDGIFLASADINSTVIIWDVMRNVPVRYRSACDLRACDAGWFLHWLDRRAFRPSTALDALTDKARFGEFRRGSVYFSLVDLTRAKAVHAHSKSWPPVPNPRGAESRRNEAHDSDSEDSTEGTTLGEAGSNQDDDDHIHDHGHDEEDEDEGLRFQGQIPVTVGQGRESARAGPRGLASGLNDHSGCASFKWNTEWPSPIGVAWESHRRDPPSVPLLKLNNRSLELYQTSHLERAPRAQPYIAMVDPLEQRGSGDWMHLMMGTDRMNLSVQIPELGLVLAGSPKGRVAVFSLHQCSPSPFSDASVDPVYTLRLDVLLPLPKDEASGKRSIRPLVGVAASPVQGYRAGRSHRGRAGQATGVGTVEALRRWRIMLLYMDHTLLTYEVWREREAKKDVDGGGGDGGSGVGISVTRDDVPLV